MYYYVQYDENNFPILFGTSLMKQDTEISEEEYNELIQNDLIILDYLDKIYNNEITLQDIPNEFLNIIQYKLNQQEVAE